MSSRPDFAPTVLPPTNGRHAVGSIVPPAKTPAPGPSQPQLEQDAHKEALLQQMAKLLREARAELDGVTMGEVATAAGIAYNTYRNAELGKHALRMDKAVAIKRELGLGKEFDEVVRALNNIQTKRQSEHIKKANAARWGESAAPRPVGRPRRTEPIIDSKDARPVSTAPMVTETKKTGILEILGPELAERALVMGLENLKATLEADLARIKSAMAALG